MDEDEDPLANWTEKHLNSDDSDDDDRFALENDLKKSLMSAGIDKHSRPAQRSQLLAPNTRNSSIYSFQDRKQSGFSKALPKPTKENLEQITDILRNNIVPHKKLHLLNALREGKGMFFEELGAVLKQLEEKEKAEKESNEVDENTLNQERLVKFGGLIKQIILMSDPQVIEILMSERHYMTAFAGLTELSEFKKRLDCREFFQKAMFREVIPFNNERILSRIHLYYRVNFFKESIFPNQEGQI